VRDVYALQCGREFLRCSLVWNALAVCDEIEVLQRELSAFGYGAHSDYSMGVAVDMVGRLDGLESPDDFIGRELWQGAEVHFPCEASMVSEPSEGVTGLLSAFEVIEGSLCHGLFLCCARRGLCGLGRFYTD